MKVSFLEKTKCDEEVLFLAIGPRVIAIQFNGFITNGYRFLKKTQEELKMTQNSRVIVVVKGGYYYGKLINIIELDYICGYKVVLFQCDWVDIRPSRGLKKDKYGFPLVNFQGHWYILPRDIYDMGSDENKDELDSYTQCIPYTIPILDDVNEAPSWHRTNIGIEERIEGD
uniref:DUF4216 domain-containing protein n=1 Tax=Tanacetum cinerariifolium TaxID=118510 RepID=A0A6L2L9M5_TANCI|nr:hypothetical protein [Tanacetum cinerariifolium]